MHLTETFFQHVKEAGQAALQTT